MSEAHLYVNTEIQVPTQQDADPGLSSFVSRHLGPTAEDVEAMLDFLGLDSVEQLIAQTVPASLRSDFTVAMPPAVEEAEALAELRQIARRNRNLKSLIGLGYYGTLCPAPIARNLLSNPAWYTAYTPYQAEISQGRLELLFYFQTMIADLTGLDLANASLLDEATACAEAMALCRRANRSKGNRFLISRHCHPNSIDVVRTRAAHLDIELVEIDERASFPSLKDSFGILLQYPATDGILIDLKPLSKAVHEAGGLVAVASDLLASVLLKPAGQQGADIAVGTSQRFGMPMGGGGPQGGFIAVSRALMRSMPGRVVGLSKDSRGRPAYRLALQTREQHIRREKATSNICTAQVLPALASTLYAIYHGPKGLKKIAERVHNLAATAATALEKGGHKLVAKEFFDTLVVAGKADKILGEALRRGYNLRRIDDDHVGVSFDETCNLEDVAEVVASIGGAPLSAAVKQRLPAGLRRSGEFLGYDCFHQYHSETELTRLLRRLGDRDLALDRTMIPLGSCTMKLNAASEMEPILWPEFSSIHPFAPLDQQQGFASMVEDLGNWLCALTGYDQMSFQPNSGSQGEFAGLLAIRAYHLSRGDQNRDLCLIPASAHGTNPASAQMAGLGVAVIATTEGGEVDMDDLKDKLAEYGPRIAAAMVTYPSTHGVFEENIGELCRLVHEAGGQVYIDGANFNAMAGIIRPGDFGGDVSHLNLHKTFCIPHGGGGPGMGPIGVKSHLAPFLPGHRHHGTKGNAVSSAPWGSPMILPIPWMYLRMMGPSGIRLASETAILSANYVAERLADLLPLLYKGKKGRIAHECLLDPRGFKESAGISVEDIAKRLIDYGIHAPTISFPVAGTLMIEPTESENKRELDRFCEAMRAILEEARQVADGTYPRDNNPLVNAPHPAADLLADDWDAPYSRTLAALPEVVDAASKYWPPVSRIDNIHGDRNPICTCPPPSAFIDGATKDQLHRRPGIRK